MPNIRDEGGNFNKEIKKGKLGKSNATYIFIFLWVNVSNYYVMLTGDSNLYNS